MELAGQVGEPIQGEELGHFQVVSYRYWSLMEDLYTL